MLFLRSLRLRALTAAAPFGAFIEFENGLNIIHSSGNTAGKSTCLQAILYALGLERSLGPHLEIPLPYAMRERIHASKDDPYLPVIQSYVELEIENGSGERLSIRRDVSGGKDSRLIQTIGTGPDGAAPTRRDFFVHYPGAAQREDGFHTFLAGFIGWQLPLVPRFDGSESPLYLEAIFPMLFVEQKRGWSAIQGPFPTFLGIQEVARRVIEFLLRLDAAAVRRERIELRKQASDLQSKWHSVRLMADRQSGQPFRLAGVPAGPEAEFAQVPTISAEVFHDGNWKGVELALAEESARLQDLEMSEVPTVNVAAPDLERRLDVARSREADISVATESLRAEFNAELQENRDIKTRIAALDVDLHRNQDAERLEKLGSSIGRAASQHVCPTCHQTISTELLPQISSVGMGIHENIAFIRSQLDFYRAASNGSDRRLEDLRVRYYAADAEQREIQKEIRGLRQSLTQPSAAPARAIIERQVKSQAAVDRLTSILESVDSARDTLVALANEWIAIQSRLRTLPASDLSPGDERKISGVESQVRLLLSDFGFRSYHPSEIQLSSDNFRPLVLARKGDEVVEREIGFEISASDAVRLKWAYYVAMLTVGTASGDHCGLLVLDEPGQQEMEISSLRALLYWAAHNLNSDQQVILATSESYANLSEALVGGKAKTSSFSGFILQPEPPAASPSAFDL